MEKWLFIIVLFMVSGRLVFAQGIQDSVFQIRTVEITAGRLFQKEQAGMKESYVDSLVLRNKINLSLSDVLAENTTVYIKSYGRGALATASFRGTAPTHTQVSWNGLNINSPMLGMVDFSLIPVYVIDDISLQHGAASVGKSSGGLGGHISIENEVDWMNRFSGRYYQGIGSFSTFDEFGQINMGNAVFQSKTRAYHNYSANDYEYINRNQLNDYTYQTGDFPAQQNEDGDYQKYGFMQEFYLKATEQIVSSAKLWYQDAYRSIPMVTSYQGNEENATRRENRQDDMTFKAVVDGAYYGSRISGKIRSGMDYQQLDYVMRNKVGGAEWETPVNSGSDMKSWYNHLQMTYQVNDQLEAEVHVDGNYYQISTHDSATGSGFDERRMEYSIFARSSMQVVDALQVQLNLRQDFIPGTEPPLIYVLGASYKPFERQNLVLKASVARNFHNPSINDLYWLPGGNPDLKSEEGITGEGGLHYLHKFGDFSLENQTTFYYSDINNWILWLPSVKGYWEATNVSRVRSYGIESNVKTTLELNKLKFNFQGNYAYTKTRNFGDKLASADESKGKQLPYIPVHSGNILFSSHFKGFYGKFQYHFYGVRHLLSSNKAGLDDDSEFFGVDGTENPFYRLYPHHLKHASIGKIFQWKKFRFEAELKIHNLFNEVYRSVLSRPMPRRYYTLMLKIDF